MALRPCLDCKEPSSGTRCPSCARVKDAARGTRQERGYDAAHDAERRRWAPRVALGLVQCWRCRRLISGVEPWDLGHCDDDRSVWHGPEHATGSCNRATAGRTGCAWPGHHRV